MANIFQRIFHTPVQCMIMDFIQDNKDSVQYTKENASTAYGLHIGKTHTVKIETDEVVLSASLTKYKPFVLGVPCTKENEASCSLVCKKPYTTKNNRVFFGTILHESDAFSGKVYKKMLDNYIAKNGCPCR